MENLIRKILREQEEDKEVDPFNDTLFAPKFMERVMG